MSIKIIADFGTLFRMASELGKAKQRNAPQEEIDRLQRRHDEYKKICLMADEMTIGISICQH